MKYIDADRLRAEIKIIQKSLEHRDVRFNQIKQIRTECMLEFCKMLNNIITSLQQEQLGVDLEKELRNYNVPFNDCGWERLTHNTLKEIARHFYELGKARKGE